MIVDGETVIIPQSKINPDFYQNYTGKPSAHIAVAWIVWTIFRQSQQALWILQQQWSRQG